MKLSIIVIGDELLNGQVTDTNSGEIARIIGSAGWTVDSVRTVRDNADAIRDAVLCAFRNTDIVLTTGGLGPTKDDITKSVLCEIFGGELRFDRSVLQNIQSVFEKRGLALNDLTRDQALVPTSCRVIQNRVGTAPIMWFEKTSQPSDNDIPDTPKLLVALPGVPFEMRQMFREEVFPQLLERFPSDTFYANRTVIVVGLSESAVAMQLEQWEESLPDGYHLAYLPAPGLIRLRVDGISTDADELNVTLTRLKDELIERFRQHLLCDGDYTVSQALLDIMRRCGLRLAVAESCTGGNISRLITENAGCSDIFLGSVVSYSNEAKMNLLGVRQETLAACGAVSEEVVRQMADGAARVMGADCAIATSGIAGPTGAVPGKPVGTVCIGWHTPQGTFAATFRFPGSRDRVIERASATAIIHLAMSLRAGGASPSRGS